jgi:hypothetical protein
MGQLSGTLPSDFSQYILSCWFNLSRLPLDTDPDQCYLFNVITSGTTFGNTQFVFGSDGHIEADVSIFRGFSTAFGATCKAPAGTITSANSWYHMLASYNGNGTKTSDYIKNYSTWAVEGDALIKMVVNGVYANGDLAAPTFPSGQLGNTEVFGHGYSSSAPVTPTNFTLATTTTEPAGDPGPSLTFASVPSWCRLSVTNISVAGLHAGTYSLGWNSYDVGHSPGILFLSHSTDSLISSGTNVTFTVAVPNSGSVSDSSDWTCGYSSEGLTINGSQFGGNDFPIRYGDFQMWLGQSIDPRDATAFSKFVTIAGGVGTPVDPTIAAAAFGTPQFRFSGNHTKFVTNTGTGGSFSLVGSDSDFTPVPSYG